MKTIFTIFIFLFISLASFAQPGTIDKSFGNEGILVDSSYDIEQVHTALQPDGKWIAAGNAEKFVDEHTSNLDFLLVRYNPDGSTDSTFGNKGSVTTEFVSTAIERCYAVSIQPDGKIVAAGTEFTYDVGYYHVAIARYNEDGTLDKTFGKEGLVDYSIAPRTTAYVKDMALQPDGKIVITGNSFVATNEPYTPFILRFAADGTVDTPFGNKGIVFLSSDNTKHLDISSVLLQPDGKIVLGGTYPFTTLPIFYVLRYLADGTPDKAFGTDGVAMRIFSEGTFSQLNSIALQKDGSIVCGGNKQLLMGDRYQPNIELMRLTASGAFDDSFGSNGQVTTIIKNGSEINNLLLQEDGKIIGAGTLNTGGEKPSFAVIRYLPDGSVDSSFGTDGLTTQTMKNGLYCSDALLQKDGKVLQSGSGFITETDKNVFVFARYNGDESKRQMIVTRIRHWLQHNGIIWQPDNAVSYYTVQRSTDGGITYQNVAKVYNNKPVYNYEEALQNSNRIGYRLAVAAKDGSRTYSNTVFTDDETQVKIFPNPVSNRLQLTGLPVAGKSRITVTDFNGNMRISVVAGSSSCFVNTSALAPGSYLLKIQHDHTVTTQIFVKQ